MNLFKEKSLSQDFVSSTGASASRIELENGNKVAVVGGGPAGCFTAYFLKTMSEMIGLEIEVDIFEPHDYTQTGPVGCNHCGGIISETLVQLLAADGINLSDFIVQRGIDSYVLHMDAGTVHIETPLHEKRIAAVHRGAGPRGVTRSKWGSFDGFLLNMAVDQGAKVIPDRVENICWTNDGRPQVKSRMGLPQIYDFVVGAIGINTNALKIFEGLDFGYKTPEVTKTFICELPLGETLIHEYLGNSMHVFLLDMPRLEFAALIPKGEFVTVCLLGEDIDKEMVEQFLGSFEVQACLPPEWLVPAKLCHCAPRINVQGALRPYADRIALVGDCGATRLYKDGIGAAYRTAKAVASTAILKGISQEDFDRHYLPTYKGIMTDNRIGKLVFLVTHLIQKAKIGRKAILRMVSEEQKKGTKPRMSTVLWDTFTGSTTYREILINSLHPAFIANLCRHFLIEIVACFGSKKISAFFKQLVFKR